MYRCEFNKVVYKLTPTGWLSHVCGVAVLPRSLVVLLLRQYCNIVYSIIDYSIVTSTFTRLKYSVYLLRAGGRLQFSCLITLAVVFAFHCFIGTRQFCILSKVYDYGTMYLNNTSNVQLYAQDAKHLASGFQVINSHLFLSSTTPARHFSLCMLARGLDDGASPSGAVRRRSGRV